MPLYEEPHPAVSMPEENEKLWRYLGFERYVELISKSTLWFARADQFEDPFEGSVTPLNLKMRENSATRRGSFSKPFSTRPRDAESYRRINFASCWHASEIESMAMWNIYQSNSVVAILSTRERMRSSINSEKEIYLGRVNYKDFSPETKDFVDETNAFNHFFTKRNNYEFEKEVRAVLLEIPPEGSSDSPTTGFPKLYGDNVLGVPVNIDPANLISEVRVHPNSPSSFCKSVEEVTRKFGCTFPIVRSEMNADPLF